MSFTGMKRVIITEKEADSISCGLDIVRPEYVKKLKTIDNEGKFKSFKSIDELRNAVEVSDYY